MGPIKTSVSQQLSKSDPSPTTKFFWISKNVTVELRERGIGNGGCLRLLQRYSSHQKQNLNRFPSTHSQHRFLSLSLSLSLSEICFYALIKLNYFSLSVHSLLELGKTKTRKRTAHHCFFSPLLSIQTQKIHCGFLRPDSRLWIIFFSILIFSSEYRSHHHTTTGTPPNSQTRPSPVSSMVIGARDAHTIIKVNSKFSQSKRFIHVYT